MKEKLEGKWFKGNVFSMSLEDFRKTKKFELGVQKPTALRTKKTKRGKEYSQFYYKPIGENEFWD